MLGLMLAAYLTQVAATNTERPPRPSQDQLLAAVLEKAPNARIVSSIFSESILGTACGLIEIDGAIEPFSVSVSWEEPGGSVITSVAVPDQNGRMQAYRVEPKPPHWNIRIMVPSHTDFDDDGLDWRDRNLDVVARRVALFACPTLTAPEGTVWVLEREPNPDPVRGARNARRAAALTNMLFGDPTEPTPPPRR